MIKEMKKQTILNALHGANDKENEVRLTVSWGRTYKLDSVEIFRDANQNNDEEDTIVFTSDNEAITVDATNILCVRVAYKD